MFVQQFVHVYAIHACRARSFGYVAVVAGEKCAEIISFKFVKQASFCVAVCQGYVHVHVSGTARRNGDAGFFSDDGDPDLHGADDEPVTWLYFDGVSTRLRDATEKDRELFE